MPREFDQNQWNRSLERSDDPNIRRQVLVFSYIYELPVGKGQALLTNASPFLNKVVSGWQVAGITTMLTGPRTSAWFSGVDPANTNQFGGRPDRVGDGNLSGSMRTSSRLTRRSLTSPHLWCRLPGEATTEIPPASS